MFDLPENRKQVHRQKAEGEHDDDGHQHLRRLPPGSELTLSASVHVHGEGIHLA